MSPEQARGRPVGSASDVFSLGIVLYELATGRHPFEGTAGWGTPPAVAARAVMPPRALSPEVPAALEALILQMLADDPGRRPTVAEVEATLANLAGGAAQSLGVTAVPRRGPTVGRDPERAALWAGFEAAESGRGVVLCLTGEPGIGKSTLVEDFLTELSARGRAHTSARGRCSERLAGTEAYLPVLEALDSVVRGEVGEAAARALRRLAPSWYAQIAPSAQPAAAGPPDQPDEAGGGEGVGERPPAPGPPASQERLKRELLALLEEVSRLRPLVFFLDDVHWADASTVDLLAYLGARCAGLRLLVLLTYRPTEMLLGPHPFVAARLELQRHGACRELPLGFLGRAEVESYLGLAFPGHQFPADFVDLIRGKTGGNPLFLVDLLRYLRDRGVIAERPGGWALAQGIPDLRRELPESVRSLIQKTIAQVGEADRRLLSAASVQGQEFDSAVVARVLGLDAAEVEERLEVLDRVHGLVRLRREQELPDGALSLRYQFVHVLYQNALYAALPPSRRRSWSAAAAAALLGHHEGHEAAVAGELALLFEAARDHGRAADYFLEAAENAGRVWAHQEAAVLSRRGLEQLALLPDSPARARRELRLQIFLSAALQATQGYASPEADRACERARALCGQLSDDGVPLLPVFFRLRHLYMIRAELQEARALAEQCLRLAHSAQDSDLVLQAHIQVGSTLAYLGDYPLALDHCEKASILFDPEQHAHHALVYGHDPLVISRSLAAWALWNLGYPAQARATVLAALSRARELGHPMSLAGALFFAMLVHWLRREPPQSRELAETLIPLATEQGMAHYLAGGVLWRGWALCEEGLSPEGVAQLRQGAAALQATGVRVYRTVTPAMLAEALAHQGQVEEGLAALAEALAVVRDRGESYWEAELHRLQGELLLQRAGAEALAPAEAEACFHQALAVARRQSAKALELRAVTSLARLYRRQGRQAEARPLLAETYGWFMEGLDLPDLREAKALLEQLS
jgi:predicted ATPase